MTPKKLTRRRFLKDLTLTCTCSSLYVQTLAAGGAWGKTHQGTGSKDTAAMEYRTLGKTGLKVSALSFGVMRLTEPAVLFQALDMGINYFDTAHVYQNGNNEKMLGDVLKQYGRQNVFIATKIPPYYKRLGMKLLTDQTSLEAKMEESLRRLQTDYVDVLLLHSITEPDWPAHAEMLAFCEKMKKTGKARFVGISFHTTGQTYVDTVDQALKTNFYDVFLATLNYKSPPEHIEALKRAHKQNVGIVAMKTQAGGYKPESNESLNPHQAALKWVLGCTFVDCAISGMVNREQLAENAGVIGTKMGWSDRKILAVYYHAVKDRYCLRCGNCSSSCQKGVDIATVHRSLMYWEGYADFDLGRVTYRELLPAESALACMRCSE
ncbi:MAG: aldo/keto reductase, partial [Desulfobacterales bacterium]|nr:aldo/keto reductase [Desulfobacterales bacterium]